MLNKNKSKLKLELLSILWLVLGNLEDKMIRAAITDLARENFIRENMVTTKWSIIEFKLNLVPHIYKVRIYRYFIYKYSKA